MTLCCMLVVLTYTFRSCLQFILFHIYFDLAFTINQDRLLVLLKPRLTCYSFGDKLSIILYTVFTGKRYWMHYYSTVDNSSLLALILITCLWRFQSIDSLTKRIYCKHWGRR
jgi:hypothetical protein